MCFSATASFTASAAVAAVGVATLARTRVDKPQEWLLASLPLAYAAHQATEGLTWLVLKHGLGPGLLAWTRAGYMVYAYALLPLLMPLAVWLVEPSRPRDWRIVPFLALGAGVCGYSLWALVAYPSDVFVRQHSIVYENAGTSYLAVAVLYVIATCGALFFSGFRFLVVVGVVNLAGLLAVLAIKAYAFSSLWCFYAAVVSVLIYIHFHKRRVAERRGAQLLH